jgi:hypothetical protein
MGFSLAFKGLRNLRMRFKVLAVVNTDSDMIFWM